MRLRRIVVVVALFASVVGVVSSPAPPAGAAANAVSALAPTGYVTVSDNGSVSAFGNAAFAGSASDQRLNAPMIAAAMTSKGDGYWLTAGDGGVFSYGAAKFFGSTGNIKLNKPVVGMNASPTDNGYRFVATDGGVFAYGDAGFFGSTGSIRLNQSIVSMATTPSGNGYWLVASDGGIFAFGDASFYGSTGSLKLNKPIVGMSATPSGRGYWLVASDGGIFSFGDAKFYGSAGSIKLAQPIVGMSATPSGGGYWLVAADGGVFTYGDATYMGSTATAQSANRTIAMASVPRKRSVETSIFYYPWYSSAAHDGSWRHWDQGGNTPPDYLAADFWPERGGYSSADSAVVNAQMAEIKATGVDTISTSWWDDGSWEDQALDVILPAAQANGLKVAAHIEPYPNRNAASLAGDYAYLMNKGIREFYVYEADRMSQAGLAAANNSLPSDVRVFGEAANFASVKNGKFSEWAAGARFTGIYSYAGFGFTAENFGVMCDSAHAYKLLCSPSVAPGFAGQRSTPIKAVVDRNNGKQYDASWNAALNAGADVVSITSYNEWHEGTQIEAAIPHCNPDGQCLRDYRGAWGDNGDAKTAYLDHTLEWTRFVEARYP